MQHTTQEIRGAIHDLKTGLLTEFVLKVSAAQVGVVVCGELRFTDIEHRAIGIPAISRPHDTFETIRRDAAQFAQAALDKFRPVA